MDKVACTSLLLGWLVVLRASVEGQLVCRVLEANEEPYLKSRICGSGA